MKSSNKNLSSRKKLKLLYKMHQRCPEDAYFKAVSLNLVPENLNSIPILLKTNTSFVTNSFLRALFRKARKENLLIDIHKLWYYSARAVVSPHVLVPKIDYFLSERKKCTYAIESCNFSISVYKTRVERHQATLKRINDILKSSKTIKLI